MCMQTWVSACNGYNANTIAIMLEVDLLNIFDSVCAYTATVRAIVYTIQL